jgi:hypothetical protein
VKEGFCCVNGDEWSGHQWESSKEKYDGIRRILPDVRAIAMSAAPPDRIETGFRGIKQAAVVLATSPQITVSPE